MTSPNPPATPRTPASGKDAPAPPPGAAPPRIGGLVPGESRLQEAWNGGSNLPSKRGGFPLYLQQWCPLKYLNARAFETTCAEGMEWKLPDAGESSDITLTFWFENLAAFLETLGLDTVFRIPSSSWSSEVYLAIEWGQNKEAIVSPWVQSLKQGVSSPLGVLPPCQYDLQNLIFSRRVILGSLTKKL